MYNAASSNNSRGDKYSAGRQDAKAIHSKPLQALLAAFIHGNNRNNRHYLAADTLRSGRFAWLRELVHIMYQGR